LRIFNKLQIKGLEKEIPKSLPNQFSEIPRTQLSLKISYIPQEILLDTIFLSDAKKNSGYPLKNQKTKLERLCSCP
jgi:hypothetical protein